MSSLTARDFRTYKPGSILTLLFVQREASYSSAARYPAGQDNIEEDLH
jgi:hypothetical protein